MRFQAELSLHGKTATGITVPDEVIEELGAGRRPRVAVTLNGHTFRTTLGSMGGVPTIPVSAAVRDAAEARAGDVLDVGLVVDDTPQTVEVPADLAQALGGDGEARAFFDQLTASQRRGFTDWVVEAKKPETRARRVEQAVAALRNKQRRH